MKRSTDILSYCNYREPPKIRSFGHSDRIIKLMLFKQSQYGLAVMTTVLLTVGPEFDPRY